MAADEKNSALFVRDEDIATDERSDWIRHSEITTIRTNPIGTDFANQYRLRLKKSAKVEMKASAAVNGSGTTVISVILALKHNSLL